MMTDPGKIAQKMIDFQKVAVSNFTEAATLAQSHTAAAVNMTLDQATWIPNEGRQAILNWMDTCEKGYKQFQSYVNDSFSNIEKCFGCDGPASKVAKTAKKASASTKKAAGAKK